MNNLSNERLAEYANDKRMCNTNDEIVSMARELLALREAQGKRKLFTCSGCGAEGLDEPLESKCHCCIDGAEWVESVLYAAPQLPAVPMQPLEVDSHGTIRFKQNAIIRKLLDHDTANGYGLNEMAREDFSAEDRMQLAQLIGYSLSGYGTLSYVTDESYDRAIAAAPKPE